MLNESVVKLLKSGMWDLATCADGEPNVVPVAVSKMLPRMESLLWEMFHGAANAKGALIITPSKVIVTTPGAENKKELC